LIKVFIFTVYQTILQDCILTYIIFFSYNITASAGNVNILTRFKERNVIIIMTKKIIALVLCLGMTSSIAAGCGNSSESSSTATTNSVASTSASGQPKEVTITVADWPKESDTTQRQLYDGYVKAMKEKYPNVTIKQDEWKYDANSFLPKAASGQLPTLYNTWFTETQKIINSEYAADITSEMVKSGFDKAINPDILNLISKDGKYYGVPESAYVMGMWYNVNLFKKARLLDQNGIPKYPKTYDELAQTAKIIKEKTGKAGFFFPTKNNQGGWEFMNIAWSFGAEFEKNVNGKWQAVFNSPEAVSALQYVKDLKWKYNVLTDNVLVEVGDMFKLFGTDQVAMAFGMTDWMNAPVNDYKMSKDNLAISAEPSGPKGSIPQMGGSLFMFSPESTPEQIEAGLQWLAIKGITPGATDTALKGIEEKVKADNAAKRITGPVGLRTWSDPERIKAEDAIYNKYKTVNMDLFKDYMQNGSKNMKPEEPINAQELYKALDLVIQSVLTDKNADPKTLLDKAAADFQKTYLDKAK
jgi:ABC-type glycerol-3-phosphate transport system substrate-binding protein